MGPRWPVSGSASSFALCKEIGMGIAIRERTSNRRMRMKNTILVSILNGIATHQFCNGGEANAILDEAIANGSGSSSFSMAEPSLSAEDVYSISPDLQSRVAKAKAKLQADWQVKLVLDKHNVPADKALRKSILAAYQELRAS